MSEKEHNTHIENISIRNFRALREIEYVPKQINIITGRNNTGKTALLDSIAFNIPGYIHKEIEKYDIEGPIDFICCGEKIAEINSNLNHLKIYSDVETIVREQNPILIEYFEKVFENFDKLRRVSDKTKNILQRDDFRDEYTYLILDNYDFITFSSDFGIAVCPYPKQPLKSKRFEKFPSVDRKLNDLIKKYEREGESENKMRPFHVMYRLALKPEILFLHERPNQENVKVAKFSHSDKLNFKEISEEELITLEEFIKNNDIVKNLRRLSQKDIVYQNAEGSLVTIPIDAHGDGLISLLNVIRYLLNVKDGILIVEEPENHLHPRYVDIFVENLFEYSKKLNVQIFMSTHSLDLIRSALKYPENYEEKEMLLISKMTSDGQNIEKFDYTVDEGLRVIDELYQDLRGN